MEPFEKFVFTMGILCILGAMCYIAYSDGYERGVLVASKKTSE